MAKGTITGKVQIKSVNPDETYSTRPLVCVKVKTKNNTTWTTGNGWYSISDEAEKHKLRFIVKTEVGFEVEIGSMDVEIEAGKEKTQDMIFDVEQSEGQVHDVLEQIIIKRDPGLPGCVSGTVRNKDNYAIKIPGATIWIDGVMQTASDELGRYAFCAPGNQSYVLHASHPTDYKDWSWSFTLAELEERTKHINMTHT